MAEDSELERKCFSPETVMDTMAEEELRHHKREHLRKAVEELLKEAKRGKTRAETMGPMGWMKCPLASTNKRFLINTIKNTLHSPKEQDPEQEHKEVDKESEPSQSREETKPKRYRIHPYRPSFQSRRRVSYSPPRHRNRNQHTKDKYEKQSSK